MSRQKKGSKNFDFTKDNASGGNRFDFTKDEPVNTPEEHLNQEPEQKQNRRMWYVAGAVVLACVVGAVAFWPDNHDQNVNPVVADSLTQVTDYPVAVDETDTVSAVTLSDGDGSVGKVTQPVETEESKEEVKAQELSTETLTPVTPEPATPASATSVASSGDHTLDAKKAIRGDFGNGAERRKNLGSDYEQVQAIVNKMYREGRLHW